MRVLIITGVLLSVAAGGCCNRPNNATNGPAAEQALRTKWSSLAGQTAWKPYPHNPIISPGSPGRWDSWGVMSMSVVKVGDVFHLYYEGGAGGVGDLQIGHVTSTDGLHWTKDPSNPVLRPGDPGRWDDGAVWDPYVIHEDGKFKMWYGGERKGHKSFQCGYAVSEDGTRFVKKGRLSNFDSERIADIHVLHDDKNDRFLMYYWNWGDVAADGARLRLALSPDEKHFDFDNSLPISIEGENAHHQYTQVFREGQTWYMYYGFEKEARTGYATSLDGIKWKAQNTRLPGTEDAEVLKVADKLYFMIYCPEGFQDKPNCDIRLAIYNGDLDDLAAPAK
ncbi:MAG TPA: hypothetical protein VMX13_02100 [Sedimentisphaerales bacterium]|nr:hypothetical protein [Sedimentisphaerales bacterium]